MTYADNWFLGALSAEDLGRLKPHLAKVEFARGQTLCEVGQPVDAVWFFRTGMSSDIHILEDGFEVEVCAFGYESAFGLAAATGRSVALTRNLCQIGGDGWRLPAAVFADCCARSPALDRLVIRHSQAAMSFMARSMACNSRHPVEVRLCRWLLTAADYAPERSLDLTHEFLSAMLGATRSSVTVSLGELQRDGLLKVSRGAIELVDRQGLMRRTCECYASTRDAWSHLRPTSVVAVGVV